MFEMTVVSNSLVDPNVNKLEQMLKAVFPKYKLYHHVVDFSKTGSQIPTTGLHGRPAIILDPFASSKPTELETTNFQRVTAYCSAVAIIHFVNSSEFYDSESWNNLRTTFSKVDRKYSKIPFHVFPIHPSQTKFMDIEQACLTDMLKPPPPPPRKWKPILALTFGVTALLCTVAFLVKRYFPFAVKA